MNTLSQRIPIAEGIGFTEILDPKFKVNALRIQFFQPLCADTAAACALACDLITSTNSTYPSYTAMNRKLHLLYGASLTSSIAKRGDIQVLTLSISSIADQYALEKEEIFRELLEILSDCILSPNLVDGGFEPAMFRIKQKNLLDAIDAEINEKRKYAISQASKAAFQGEPAALSCYGSRAEAERLTPQSTYEAFRKLLKTANAEIYAVSPVSQPDLPKRLQALFAEIPDRTPVSCTFSNPSPQKAEPVTTTEQLPVSQCKMVLVWKTTESNDFATRLMAALFGGTPSSKLFANVREKMSLCYYCAANYVETKRAMLVDCGVEADQIQKAKKAILAQLEALQQGDFTEEELENTKTALRNSLLSVGDSTSSYTNWYFTQFCKGTYLTPEEENLRYADLTREQIMTAAQSMHLDTIYIMERQEGTSNGND